MDEVRTCRGPECREQFTVSAWNQKYCSPDCKRDARYARERHPEVVIDSDAESSYDEDFEELVDYLRRDNRRLTNLVKKHKYGKAEQTEAIYKAFYDATQKMKISNIKPPKLPKAKRGIELVANPSLSDWQLGKTTPSYDSDVCAERIEQFAFKAMEIVETQRNSHPINICHVHILGDIVEGENIFKGQTFEIDSSLYRQVIRGVEILSKFLYTMLENFDQVHVTAVIGNHGRLSYRGEFNPETNMDRLLYKFVSILFEDEPRISFDIPDGYGESSFYAVDYIGNYGTLLMHGDQLSQPTSMHSYYKKIFGWKDTGIPERFDAVKIGHWHQNTKATLGTTLLYICGTPESDNHFAQEKIGVMGRPSQGLHFVRPDVGVFCEYDIYLDED